MNTLEVKKMRVDLHVHTNISDSSLSTKDTILLAKSRRLTHLAITNHDTVYGLKEAIEFAQDNGIVVIPGIEISAYDFKRQIKVHILGYCFNLKAPHIKALVDKTNQRRDQNTKWQVKQLITAGYDLTIEEVAQKAKESTAFYKQHIFDVLTHKGYTREELKPLFNKGGICNRVITYVDATEAVKAIKADGGIAVIAHPGQSKAYDLIPDLVKVGLDGIEKFHPDHDELDHGVIDQLANEYQLFVTTGSDFHSTYGPNRPFGTLVMDHLPFKIKS